jgi:hypothetical protein
MGNDRTTQLAVGASEAVQVSGRIRSVRFIYGLLAAIYWACVIIQVLLAGMGVFVDKADLQFHRAFVNYFEFGSIIMFLLSFAGSIKGGLRWYPLGLFALTTLQHMSLFLPAPLPAIHTVDALLLFGLSLYLMKRSWSWVLLR